MILVVAINPALDVTHHVDSVDWSGVNRPAAVRVSPGGKGLNVARVLHALGSDVLLVGLAGGMTGNAVRSALSAANVPAAFAETTGETRRTFAVVDTGRGETAIFNEPGPLVSTAEFAGLTALYAEALKRSSAVVLSGSLPPGLPASSYADLIVMATDARVPVLLDTSGEALKAGVPARPAIVKPNLAELCDAVDSELRPAAGRTGRVAAAAAAAAGLRDRGADAVVVTLGADGMLAMTADGSWLATTTPVSGNPTGAGDAVAAALARGLALGSPWPDRLAEAAALGAAAVSAPVAGEIRTADYNRALADVQVTSWEQP